MRRRLVLAGALLLSGFLHAAETRRPTPAREALRYQKDVLHRLDFPAAARFLKDKPTQAWLLKNRPERAAEIFVHAARLKDLEDMLAAQEDADDLRLAMIARGSLVPKKLLAFIDQKPELAPLRPRIDLALWEWDALPSEIRQWLERRGVAREAWTAATLQRRHDTIEKWAEIPTDEILSAAPKTEADLKRLEELKARVWGALAQRKRLGVADALRKAQACVRLLAEAENLLAGASAPELKPLLEQARHASDTDSVLNKLGMVFDGLGLADKDLQAFRPDSRQVRFTHRQTARLQEMLPHALLREISGLRSGRKTVDFYRRHRLNIEVARFDPLGLADYGSGRIRFNEKYIANFLDAAGATPERLLSNRSLFKRFISLISPIFIHEAMHQMQDVWSRDHGIDMGRYSQLAEIEAFLVQALYTREKIRADRRYAPLLKENSPRVAFARRVLQTDQDLQMGLESFQRKIMGIYASGGSLEMAAAYRLESNDFSSFDEREFQTMRAVLAGRSRLPGRERQKLEDRLSDGTFSLEHAKTSALRKKLREVERSPSRVMESYAKLRRRLQAVVDQVARGLARLEGRAPAGAGPAP